MSKPKFVPLAGYREYSEEEMKRRAAGFRADVHRRRTVRQFSDRAVPREVIEDCLAAAGSAPSGANLQPWHFVAIADPQVKRRIRGAAEKEEQEFYGGILFATSRWSGSVALNQRSKSTKTSMRSSLSENFQDWLLLLDGARIA